MTTTLANALAPIFTGLLVGYLSGKWGVIDNRNVQTLTIFTTSFAIPCSIFLAVAGAPRSDLSEEIGPALVLAFVYIVVYSITFFWVHSKEGLNAADSSVLALTTGFPNSAAVGLPLLASVFGTRSAITVATSIAIGSITVSPLTLVILERARASASEGFKWRKVFAPVMRSVSKPIVWAPLLGLGFSFAGLHLPSFAVRSLAVIGSASVGAALVLTGLVVSAQVFRIGTSLLIPQLLKFLLQPALALVIARFVGLPIEQIRYVTLIGAMPCGFFGVVFGRSFGSNPPLASSALIVSYVVSVPALAAWIVIVSNLK